MSAEDAFRVSIQAAVEGTTAAGADGTSECPGGSSHERGASAEVTNPGTFQQAEKSIRVRNAGEKLRPRPRFSSHGFHTSG